MKIFTLYFELYGKKMKTDIVAVDVDDAKRQLEKKIVYHKVESKPIPKTNGEDVFEYLKRVFKMNF